jgi:hypothetical protein
METDIITGMPSPSPSVESSKSNMWKYLIIFLILAVLGFNLFTYVGKFSFFLGELSDKIISVFKPILAYFGYGVTETAKKTIDLTAKGSKKAIDVTSGTITGGINVLQGGLSRGSSSPIRSEVSKESTRATNRIDVPIPDDAGSVTQLSKAKNKSGFCYIGEDRGFRSCISVGEGDTCMSGDIFPSQELCINPNLR